MRRQGLAIALGVAVVALGCVRIDSGQAAVLWSALAGGTQEEVYGEGLQIVAPWNRMYVYDVRIQDRVENLHVLSRNGLSVGMETSIRYQLVASELAKLHTDIGGAYFDRIIQPVVRSAAREVVAQFTPEELYSTKRDKVGGKIFDAVEAGLEGKHITLLAVLIRNVELPEKIKRAISEKLEEQQKAQKMEFTLARERKEAERKAIEATGIAEFQRIVTTGITDALLRWKGIEATQALATSANAKVVVVGGGRDGLPIILGGVQ